VAGKLYQAAINIRRTTLNDFAEPHLLQAILPVPSVGYRPATCT